MQIPTITFHMTDETHNVEFIKDLLHPEFLKSNTSLPFAERVYGLFPELKERICTDMSYEEVDSIIDDVVKGRYYVDDIEKRLVELDKEFQHFYYEFMIKQLQLFEIPSEYVTSPIRCYVGCYPVFPRSVLTKEYYVNFSTDIKRIITSSIHEINHFVLYDKWILMHGHGNEKEPVHPEPLWFLEEIAVDSILNDPILFSYSPYQQQAYPQFYTAEIHGKNLMDTIKQIYEEREHISGFLEEAYRYINENLNEIIEKCG